jgi:hypothetical protein
MPHVSCKRLQARRYQRFPQFLKPVAIVGIGFTKAIENLAITLVELNDQHERAEPSQRTQHPSAGSTTSAAKADYVGFFFGR